MDIFEFVRKRLSLNYISDLHFCNKNALERVLADLPKNMFSQKEIDKVRAYAYVQM